MSATEPIDTRTLPLEHEPIEDWQRLDEPAGPRRRPSPSSAPSAASTTDCGR
ncbi:hypothetical protein AB0365_06340 [Brevibacterium casei]|uniref:hypothetical protein n=1 Tax=Brevibacterium casei TaxID=33889 RepID=UPI00344D610E